MDNYKQYDVIIVGSGAAGLTLALSLPKHLNIAVISKTSVQESATYYAQGGISAVMDDDDSVDSHVADTLKTGAGLCREDAVKFIVENGKSQIEWLKQKGVAFTTRKSKSGKSELHLTQEGGHSARRVVHAADKTGKAVETTLVEKFKSTGVTLLENFIAIDLIKSSSKRHAYNKCIGLYVYDVSNKAVMSIESKVTVLATGGAGKVYLYTSNPDISTGDGIAMAWRAGCSVANMEFVQFHPTCLFHPKAKSLLITEAVRGEGGKLLLPSGEQFMQKYDERAELAPRDIVAKAIDSEMKRIGCDSLFLDISHKSAAFILKHFPNAHEVCLRYGFDLTKEAIPIVPAAHYLCGGIVTDLTGKTSMQGLFAIGETACTGLHGANRMASNSLLECLVLAEAASKEIMTVLERHRGFENAPSWDESQVTDSEEDIMISHNWDELRRTMWNYVGIVRSKKRLLYAKRRVELLKSEIAEFYGDHKITPDLIELRNLIQVADLIIRSAMKRKESRGLHFNLDYPHRDSKYQRDTLLNAGDFS